MQDDKHLQQNNIALEEYKKAVYKILIKMGYTSPQALSTMAILNREIERHYEDGLTPEMSITFLVD